MAYRIIKRDNVARVYTSHQGDPERMTVGLWYSDHILLIDAEEHVYSYAVREHVNDNGSEVRATLTNVY